MEVTRMNRSTYPQPSPVYRASAKTAVVGAMLFGLAGTGGALTAEGVAIRASKGYRIPSVQYVETAPTRSSGRRQVTVAECLQMVKRAFALSMTELANVFGLSRQAIYNWQAGGAINGANLERLRMFDEAASLVISQGISASDTRRKLPGGKTVLEAIISGVEPSEAVSRLLSMLVGEQYESAPMAISASTRSRNDLSEAGLRVFDERS